MEADNLVKVRYFAKLDEDGVPIGFYPSDIWPVPPVDTIEITKEQWREFLNKQSEGKLLKMSDGAMVPHTRLPPPMTVPMSYAAAIVTGLVVTSASGIIQPITVSLAMQQLSNLANVSIYIMRHDRFPGGQDSLPLVAADGSSVDVPSTDAWQEIATAAADFVVKCDVALKAGMESGTWVAPSNAVTIT